MQALDGAVSLRRRGIAEILELAGRTYAERTAEFYKVAAVTLLASWTLDLVIQTWTIGGVPLGALADPRTPEFFRFVASVFGAGVAHGMVYALCNSVGVAVIMVAMAARANQEMPGIGEAFRAAAPRLGPLLGATLLFFLAVAGLVGLGVACVGMVAALGLILAGGGAGIFAAAIQVAAGLIAAGAAMLIALVIFYLCVRWVLYQQAAVLEGCGPLEALRRSMEITRDAPATGILERFIFRGAVLLVILVLLQGAVGAVGALPSLAVGLILRGTGDQAEVSVLNPTGMPLFLLIPLEILSVLLSAAVLPYSVAVFTILYQDVLGRSQIGPPSGKSP
ncbi:MAG TPA: hypothetical protein VGK94_01115 [Candidatus Polarisedimenticolia bacterium]|jgi:hypothetical protein